MELGDRFSGQWTDISGYGQFVFALNAENPNTFIGGWTYGETPADSEYANWSGERVIDPLVLTLEVNPSAAGTVSASPWSPFYGFDARVKVSPVASELDRFAYWMIDGINQEYTETITLAMNVSHKATAVFTKKSLFQYYYSAVFTNYWMWNKLLDYYYVGYYPFIFTYKTDDWIYVIGENEDLYYIFNFHSNRWWFVTAAYYPAGWEYIEGQPQFRMSFGN